MDYEIPCKNMVEQQVRPWNVLNPAVLDLMMTYGRERFVPEKFVEIAYADVQVPLVDGEVMLSPKVVGRILDSLDLQHKQKVLEIGTGSGYLTMLASKLCHSVTSFEIHPEIYSQAKKNIEQCKANNVELIQANALTDLRGAKIFDVVIVTGSASKLPQIIYNQVKPGGKLFAFLGNAPTMQAIILQRTSKEDWSHVTLFETIVPRLKGLPKDELFEL